MDGPAGDRGAVPEPRAVVAPFAREMHDWFGTPPWATVPPPNDAPRAKP